MGRAAGQPGFSVTTDPPSSARYGPVLVSAYENDYWEPLNPHTCEYLAISLKSTLSAFSVPTDGQPKCWPGVTQHPVSMRRSPAVMGCRPVPASAAAP